MSKGGRFRNLVKIWSDFWSDFLQTLKIHKFLLINSIEVPLFANFSYLPPLSNEKSPTLIRPMWRENRISKDCQFPLEWPNSKTWECIPKPNQMMLITHRHCICFIQLVQPGPTTQKHGIHHFQFQNFGRRGRNGKASIPSNFGSNWFITTAYI